MTSDAEAVPFAAALATVVLLGLWLLFVVIPQRCEEVTMDGCFWCRKEQPTQGASLCPRCVEEWENTRRRSEEQFRLGHYYDNKELIAAHREGREPLMRAELDAGGGI